MTDWDARFLALARYVATWSKDPSTAVGAVVVARDDRRKMSHGYNGFGPGIADDDRLYHRPTKYRLIQHAERNALDNATFDVAGGTLYCPLPPCVECAKSIIGRRIARVVTHPHPPTEAGRWTEQIPNAQLMLAEAGVQSMIVNHETHADRELRVFPDGCTAASMEEAARGWKKLADHYREQLIAVYKCVVVPVDGFDLSDAAKVRCFDAVAALFKRWHGD